MDSENYFSLMITANNRLKQYVFVYSKLGMFFYSYMINYLSLKTNTELFFFYDIEQFDLVDSQ